MNAIANGALKGAMTFSKFFVDGGADGFPADAGKRLHATTFLPLSPEEDVAERHGWCAVGDPADLDVTPESAQDGDMVALGIRIDTWTYPKPLLRARLREAEAELLERKGLERLGKKAKADLKLFVMKTLRKSLVPETRSIDLVWNTARGEALLFTHSPKLHLLVQELFERTFRARLVPASAGVRADRAGLDASTDNPWANLEPMTLAQESAS